MQENSDAAEDQVDEFDISFNGSVFVLGPYGNFLEVKVSERIHLQNEAHTPQMTAEP